VNPFDILKNAQALQERMGGLQARMDALRATGSAGGGMARVTIDGGMRVGDVASDKECLDPARLEQDIPLLQDLIKAAHADAMAKMKEAIAMELKSAASGLGIDPSMLNGLR